MADAVKEIDDVETRLLVDNLRRASDEAQFAIDLAERVRVKAATYNAALGIAFWVILSTPVADSSLVSRDLQGLGAFATAIIAFTLNLRWPRVWIRYINRCNLAKYRAEVIETNLRIRFQAWTPIAAPPTSQEREGLGKVFKPDSPSVFMTFRRSVLVVQGCWAFFGITSLLL